MPARSTPAHPGSLEATLARIESTTSYRAFEILLVAEDPALPPSLISTLSALPHQVLRAAGSGFNFSARVNQGAAAARGDHILVLHDDAEPLDGAWLDAMLELSEQPGVGAVGAKLYYPHGALQHIGLIVGMYGLAGRPFQGHHADSLGYFSNANCIRNCSAVSGACLMTRREVFSAVSGFDEALPTHAGDIDYCLRVGAAGYRVVFTPYARLTHHEAGRLGEQPVPPATTERLRARWGVRFDRDPFYNPNLTREFLDYRVEP
jgi:GT2 family glycosyltransferase